MKTVQSSQSRPTRDRDLRRRIPNLRIVASVAIMGNVRAIAMSSGALVGALASLRLYTHPTVKEPMVLLLVLLLLQRTKIPCE